MVFGKGHERRAPGNGSVGSVALVRRLVEFRSTDWRRSCGRRSGDLGRSVPRKCELALTPVAATLCVPPLVGGGRLSRRFVPRGSLEGARDGALVLNFERPVARSSASISC